MSEMIERLISLGFSRSRARAAIAAMREPTEAMKHASTMIAPTWDDNISAEKWRAMIDVALGDDKRGMSKSAPSLLPSLDRGASSMNLPRSSPMKSPDRDAADELLRHLREDCSCKRSAEIASELATLRRRVAEMEGVLKELFTVVRRECPGIINDHLYDKIKAALSRLSPPTRKE